MYLDFHTHGKLAKYLPFSIPYTQWLLGEAHSAGLDAICLTEHFNTRQFDEVYGYIAAPATAAATPLSLAGSRYFPGWKPILPKAGTSFQSARWTPSGS